MITMIVAADDILGIGKDGKIPWHIKEELAFFRKTTVGNGNNAIIMGRKTHDSIGLVLPLRRNIVLTRESFSDDSDRMPERHIFLDVAHSKEEALRKASYFDEIFIIGGAEIYNLFLEDCNRILISRIKGNFDCDVFLPVHFDMGFIESEEPIITHNDFITYELKRSA